MTDTQFDTIRAERAEKISALQSELTELSAPLDDALFLSAVNTNQGLPRANFPLIPDKANVEITEGDRSGTTGVYVGHNVEWGMAAIDVAGVEVHVPYTWVIVHDTIEDPSVEIPIAPDVSVPVS